MTLTTLLGSRRCEQSNHVSYQVILALAGLLSCTPLLLTSIALADDLFVASWASASLTRVDGATGITEYSTLPGFTPINLVEGPEGALYVTTLFASSVVRIDPASGLSLGVFAAGGGLATSVGVAFGPDGDLYVGSRDSNSVVRFDGTNGSAIGTFVASGSGGLVQTEAILFGPDGNLYVTEFYGDRVLRYDGTTGAFIDVFASNANLSYARSMAFGPDGNLYVAGTVSDNVVRFDGNTGAFVDVFASGIDGANGLVFGPDGYLYVAAEVSNKIQRFDGTTGAAIGDFAYVTGPIGIVFAKGVLVPEPGMLTLAVSACLAWAGKRRSLGARSETADKNFAPG